MAPVFSLDRLLKMIEEMLYNVHMLCQSFFFFLPLYYYDYSLCTTFNSTKKLIHRKMVDKGQDMQV